MNMLMIIGIVTALVLCHGEFGGSAGVPFDKYYAVTYGYNNVKFLNQERSEVRISLDKTTGSGFGSKSKYGSGLFKISAKLPRRDCGGVVTAFYLSSGSNNHDEVDLEFLGNRPGRSIILQTNVFANGVGGREQRIVLWFDPSDDYHTYKVLWNPHQIVIFIDETPIRVFKNNTAIGVPYPWQPMQVLASIWDGSSWATDGGKTKVIWEHAPFNADYKGLYINGCHRPSTCSYSKYWWNRREYWELSRAQVRKYRDIARKYLDYDYCTDRKRYPVTPRECASNR